MSQLTKVQQQNYCSWYLILVQTVRVGAYVANVRTCVKCEAYKAH